MSDLQTQKIISTISAEDFIGRTFEMDALAAHACGAAEKNGILLASAPAVGASELLKQTYDRIFRDQNELVPFYFAIKKSDGSLRQCAARFLQTFVRQTIAKQRNDAKLLDLSGELSELAELAVPSDGYWIDRLIENCCAENCLNDERTFLRTCLSAPFRAAAHGLKIFVMIDGLHEIENFSGAADFLAELHDAFERSKIFFVLGGRRRFLSENIHLKNSSAMQIRGLKNADAGLLIEHLAEKNAVAVNEQTSDLIAEQFGGKPFLIECLFESAKAGGQDLDNFQAVEKVYIEEVFSGKIGRFYDAIFNGIASSVETQKEFLSLLYDALTNEQEKSASEMWKPRVGLTDENFYAALRRLNYQEIIRLTSNLIEAMSEDEILSDYLKSRFRLEMLAEPRALVIAETLSGALKRAPQLMARLYRRKTAIGLREVLAAFDAQEIPASLLDYALFKKELKGAPDEEILRELNAENAVKVRLPQIVYAANTVAFYAPIEQIIEKERSATAFGFEKAVYTNADEIVWIAAEIDSKLEATKDLTEFWCDRLEVAALMCDFQNYKIWLVAPEGFAPEALEFLSRRRAYGSSRKQINLLIKTLEIETPTGAGANPNEYEMIVPMGDDTEMIAAQTIEEIARRHHFSPKAINQIKTALVEACINAAEHSHSPDRKIYQKFAVEDDRLIVTVANRGLRLTDKQADEITPDQGRRGWGLKLMRNLMDDVKIEQTDDGTRISMTKFLEK